MWRGIGAFFGRIVVDGVPFLVWPVAEEAGGERRLRLER
jgi:hypothetical protein